MPRRLQKIVEDVKQLSPGLGPKPLRLILSTLSEILREIYVVPAVRAEKRKAILELKDEILAPDGRQL